MGKRVDRVQEHPANQASGSQPLTDEMRALVSDGISGGTEQTVERELKECQIIIFQPESEMIDRALLFELQGQLDKN